MVDHRASIIAAVHVEHFRTEPVVRGVDGVFPARASAPSPLHAFREASAVFGCLTLVDFATMMTKTLAIAHRVTPIAGPGRRSSQESYRRLVSFP